MQGGDEVVVLFPVLVVGRRAALQNTGEGLGIEGLVFGDGEQGFGQGKHIAPVAVGHSDQRFARGERQRQRAAFVGLGPFKQGFERLVIQSLQHVDLAPGQQRAVQLERRVLGGGAHQRHVACLHERQKPVLLSAVKAVDFIDEQQSRLPRRPPRPRRLKRLFQVGDAGEDGRKLLELIPRCVGQQPRDGGLADAGRPPQDHGRQPMRRRHPPDRPLSA